MSQSSHEHFLLNPVHPTVGIMSQPGLLDGAVGVSVYHLRLMDQDLSVPAQFSYSLKQGEWSVCL